MTIIITMKSTGYEKIKEMGWDAFQKQFIAEKCDNNWENLKPFFEANPRCYQKFYQGKNSAQIIIGLIVFSLVFAAIGFYFPAFKIFA